MGNKGRWEYVRAIHQRYRKAGRKGKKVILSELCANMGYHRKYAIRLLNGARPEIEKQLLKISPRQMDRRLNAQKTQRRRRIYGSPRRATCSSTTFQ